ncbi:hypothetical protein WR25_06656 [Diploscapter pachys]|uniref:Uncharacterized protein n=1 Tax=Diploscapter pachys TaxID=2018661 RepID=A0A2A2JUJ7_9BILA|nr:hypothetical protein WR25_06656 [Diploscapter pachys]
MTTSLSGFADFCLRGTIRDSIPSSTSLYIERSCASSIIIADIMSVSSSLSSTPSVMNRIFVFSDRLPS